MGKPSKNNSSGLTIEQRLVTVEKQLVDDRTYCEAMFARIKKLIGPQGWDEPEETT